MTFDSAIQLRRRSGWEAADMGILLWRQNWPALLLFFGIPSGLFTLALFFIIPHELDSAAYALGVLLWWPKPFFDRFALHVAAVRFFQPGARAGKLLRGLGKCLWIGLPGDLLWRRFSLYRPSYMPPRVLEGLPGKALKRRLALLGPRGLHFGFPVTLACLALGAALAYGELSFIYGVFELMQPGFLGDFWEYTSAINITMMVLSWFNALFVETLFVCMGFCVYINARVETEGWDIEILFKRLSENRRRSAPLFPLSFFSPKK